MSGNATAGDDDTVTLAPEARRFRRFRLRATAFVAGACGALAWLGGSSPGSSQMMSLLTVGLPWGLGVAACLHVGGWGFFRGIRNHRFIGDATGILVQVGDYDGLIPWPQIRAVCPRGEHIHLNTAVRLGSFELHFIDPAAGDRLYRLFRRHQAYGDGGIAGVATGGRAAP